MNASWKQFEGQAVDGIPLLRLLGEGVSSAVYAGELAGKPCAIKLVRAEEAAAPDLLAHWQQASKLSHPHLTGIEQWGRAKLNGGKLVYLAMEYAEEVLASVDRPLTAKEAREMLAPAVEALAFVHSKGMAHGRIKPANILSVNETLKISGDAPMRAGERIRAAATPYDPPELSSSGVTPAGDVWSLGATLVEAMTKKLPKFDGASVELPETLRPDSFRDVALGCLERDPARRWSVADLQRWLDRGTIPAPKPPKRRYAWAAVAAGVLIIAGILARPYLAGTAAKPAASAAPPVASSAAPPTSSAAAPAPAPPAPADAAPANPPAETPPAAAPEPPPASRAERIAKAAKPKPAPDARPAEVDGPRAPDPEGAPAEKPAPPSATDNIPASVLQPVRPAVSAKARATIRGKVLVYVRIEADTSGAVTAASVESGGSSRYFANLSAKAAHQWKFAPADMPQVWRVRFEFVRNAESPVSVQASRLR